MIPMGKRSPEGGSRAWHPPSLPAPIPSQRNRSAVSSLCARSARGLPAVRSSGIPFCLGGSSCATPWLQAVSEERESGAQATQNRSAGQKPRPPKTEVWGGIFSSRRLTPDLLFLSFPQMSCFSELPQIPLKFPFLILSHYLIL